MGVKTTFLQGNLEVIYMRQPAGYVSEEYPDGVCKIKKSIYGLKQSARCWNNAIDTFLKSSGYNQMESDPCLYIKSIKDHGKMKIMREVKHVLEMLIKRDGEREKMTINQSKHLEGVLKRLGMEHSNLCQPL